MCIALFKVFNFGSYTPSLIKLPLRKTVRALFYYRYQVKFF